MRYSTHVTHPHVTVANMSSMRIAMKRSLETETSEPSEAPVEPVAKKAKTTPKPKKKV